MLTQRQIDQRSGHAGTFWKNVVKCRDGKWIWYGKTNTNHNTVDCEKYHYGEFELVTKETSNLSKPTRAHQSKMAHHIILFLTYGRPIPRGFEVFPFNGDHLDINPANLGVRCAKTRQEWRSAEFFATANDNHQEMRAAA